VNFKGEGELQNFLRSPGVGRLLSPSIPQALLVPFLFHQC